LPIRDYEQAPSGSGPKRSAQRSSDHRSAALIALQRSIGNAGVEAMLRNPSVSPNIFLQAAGPVAAAPDAGTATEVDNSDIDGLELQGDVGDAAKELRRQVPAVQFTSGRRTLEEDCSAVAKHIADDPGYVDIFVNSRPKRLIKAWVEKHPKATRAEIANGLAEILEPMDDTERSYWSLHLGGRAFDVSSSSATLTQVRKVFPQALSEEGHWHVQFPSKWQKP
jgi:hypothetical protein